MRHLMHCAIGLALVIGCTDPQGLATSEGTGDHAGPAFARAEVIRTNVGFGISAPDSPLIVWVGFEEGVTLADICSGPQPLSLNSISHIVLPPSGAFLAASHGQDVPVLVMSSKETFVTARVKAWSRSAQRDSISRVVRCPTAG